MIWVAVQVLGSALMAAGGILAVRRSRRLGTALVSVMLLLIVVKAGISHFPAGEPRLFPWDWYPFVESWWYLFPAMFIFGTGMVIVRRSVWKRDGLLVGAGYLLLHCGVVAVLIGRPHEMLTGVVNAEGICHQTSGYSCAPASAAMLLHRHGVDATEKEMAELCVTRAGNSRVAGTTDSGLMRGLRHKLKDQATPVITLPSYERIPVPALVPIQLSPSLCHCILVSAVEPDQVRVLDPLYGRGTIPRAQFERMWCKSAIHVALKRSPS
jgi:hypothetical protein